MGWEASGHGVRALLDEGALQLWKERLRARLSAPGARTASFADRVRFIPTVRRCCLCICVVLLHCVVFMPVRRCYILP